MSDTQAASGTEFPGTATNGASVDTLVVVSKVKKFIKDQSGLNTSQEFIDSLSKRIASECLRGVENAKTAGRKTVMGRDI